MRPIGFHHAAVLVRDLERCTAFYRDVLGLPELQRHFHPDGSLRSVWLAIGNAGFLAIEQAHLDLPPKPETAPGHHLVALRIAPEERARAERELIEKGVEIEKRSPWTIYVRDPEGNRVGLSHHPHPAPER